MRRWIGFTLCLLALLGVSSAGWVQPAFGATPVVIAPAPRPLPLPKYDYWVTSGNTSVALNVPAGFFGSGSNALNTTVELTGQPFGAGAGAGLPASADTSVQRTKDPNLPSIGSVATVGIKIHGLSLSSIAPVTVTYVGGGSELWDVHVGLSSLVAQPWGSLTAKKTFAGGGTFDSSLTVVPKFTFTRVSGGAVHVLDVGNPGWGIPASTIAASATPWVANLPGNSGTFHPGYDRNTLAALIYYVTVFSNNCAEHEAKPCEDCPDDDPDVEPIDPIDIEPIGTR
jgi:hypothetical protein